jgi:hypothetical protein
MIKQDLHSHLDVLSTYLNIVLGRPNWKPLSNNPELILPCSKCTAVNSDFCGLSAQRDVIPTTSLGG